MSTAPCPAPGLYPDVPAAEYHTWDAASNSRLSLLARSPAHMRWADDNPGAPTDAQVLGDATHYAVLQPDLFPARYVCAPECDRRTKVGKETWEAFVAEHQGAKILKRDDYTLCLAMRDAVHAHPAARSILAAEHRELSMVWVDEDAGVTCKARVDMADASAGIVADLKTTTDAAPAAFARSVANFGYHRQAAHYLAGLAALGIQMRGFLFVCVEKAAPYAVAAYRLDDDAIDAGRRQVRTLLARYRECAALGDYPGYGDDIVSLALPAWAYTQDIEGP